MERTSCCLAGTAVLAIMAALLAATLAHAWQEFRFEGTAFEPPDGWSANPDARSGLWQVQRRSEVGQDRGDALIQITRPLPASEGPLTPSSPDWLQHPRPGAGAAEDEGRGRDRGRPPRRLLTLTRDGRFRRTGFSSASSSMETSGGRMGFAGGRERPADTRWRAIA